MPVPVRDAHLRAGHSMSVEAKVSAARRHAERVPVPEPPRSDTGDWMAALRDDVLFLLADRERLLAEAEAESEKNSEALHRAHRYGATEHDAETAVVLMLAAIHEALDRRDNVTALAAIRGRSRNDRLRVWLALGGTEDDFPAAAAGADTEPAS